MYGARQGNASCPWRTSRLAAGGLLRSRKSDRLLAVEGLQSERLSRELLLLEYGGSEIIGCTQQRSTVASREMFCAALG